MVWDRALLAEAVLRAVELTPGRTCEMVNWDDVYPLGGVDTGWIHTLVKVVGVMVGFKVGLLDFTGA